jgi:hypothetical protein
VVEGLSGFRGRRTRIRVSGVVLTVLALLLVVLAVPSGARENRPTPVGSDDFIAAEPYTGDFPDPSVLRVGNTYYAYGTTINFLNLPVMSSRDLITWTARTSNDPDRWWLNDAMPIAGSWVQTTKVGRRFFGATWAPHVVQRGKYFLAAYSAPLNGGRGKRCIGIAAATSPLGPFVDSRATPVVCPTRQGAIDPYIFLDRKVMYLLWKGDTNSVLYSARLVNRGGIHSITGKPKALLSVKLPWEGTIIENPAMVRYRGKLRLFYSANSFALPSYATGLAECRTPTGPCKRSSNKPFLASKWGLAGPGGATPFFDKRKRLHLVYHAWRAGQTGYPSNAECRTTALGCAQRRMYIATIGPAKKGRIKLTKMYLRGP